MKEYSSESGTVLPDVAPIPVQLDAEFAHVPLKAVVSSLTNQRKRFDEAKLADLAESIKTVGVQQPVLMRPLPGSRVADTDRGVKYELVFGERRLRASVIAGVATIPARIRMLTDTQVLEIQIIENLQREDLTYMEEAEGYKALMDAAGLNADQVGEKIGKSRNYVYSRLKLLDLCAKARESLRDGTIDFSRALLVARIPDEKLQVKAMKEIAEGVGYYDKEPMTYKKAEAHVQQNYMLKLSDAKFKIAQVDLVQGVGSCKTCPKRTGANPDLFSDVKSADVCTDPPCFHKKEQAHAESIVKAAKDKGQTVIAGKEAAELATSGYQNKFKGYKRLDSADDSPTNQPLRKIIGKQMQAEGIAPVMIENPRDKNALVAALPNEVVLRLLKTVQGQAAAAKEVTKEVQELVDDKRLKAEAKAKAGYEQDWRNQLVASAWEALRDRKVAVDFTVDVHRYLALRTAKNLSIDDSAAICKLLDLGKVATQAALIDYAKTCPRPDRLHLLMIMQHESSASDWGYGGRIANEGMHLVAGIAFPNTLAQLTKAIKSESMARFFPKVKAEKANVATAPAARPKEGAGGSKGKGSASKAPPARVAKLSAEEATQGIADALQGIEGTASAKAVAPSAEPAGAGKPALMYRGPNGETWGGRGQKPTWVKAYLEKGGELQDIEGTATDPLYARALALIIREGKANKRLLKAELGIGQTKALELLDQLEAAGKVSACDERGARKVLVAA